MSFYFDLPGHHGYVTRMVTPENPSGCKGGACRADPADPTLPHGAPARKLGIGWKVNPFITMEPGECATLMDVDGPGVITYLWIATDHNYLSELVLRAYWDGEEYPSIECPLGAFFGMGFDFVRHTVYSAMVTVAPKSGMNCYWPMPFRKHARLTLTNESAKPVRIVAYKVLYDLRPIGDDAAYFHAQYRRTLTSKAQPEHVILNGVEGEGAYVGTYLAWCPFSTGWWGEGEVKFYLDGDLEFPTIADTGTEDYFGGAWNFGAPGQLAPESLLDEMHFERRAGQEQVYNAPFCGVSLADAANSNGPRKYSLYRWHANDSIAFLNDLKVTVQTLAWLPDHTYRPSTDDIASVGYWYQLEPHKQFPALPDKSIRWDR